MYYWAGNYRYVSLIPFFLIILLFRILFVLLLGMINIALANSATFTTLYYCSYRQHDSSLHLDCWSSYSLHNGAEAIVIDSIWGSSQLLWRWLWRKFGFYVDSFCRWTNRLAIFNIKTRKCDEAPPLFTRKKCCVYVQSYCYA